MFEHTQTQPPLYLLDSIAAVKKERWQESPFWLQTLRQEGRLLFEQLGLPRRNLEEWKYTDVSPIAEHPFITPRPLTHQWHDQLTALPLSPLRLVFVNGFYVPTLAQIPTLPPRVIIGSLGEALSQNSPLLEKHLANYAMPEDNPFVALNNAFIEDGAFVYIPANVHLAHPIHIVYFNIENKSETNNTPPIASHPRNLIIVEAGASASIIEDYIGTADIVYLNNPVTEIFLDQDASLEHYKLQRESQNAFHVATISVRQEQNSHFASHSFSFGSQLTRNNINSYLQAPHSECSFNGLVMVRHNQHVDNHTLIHHSHPHCHSNQLYHGILDDLACGVFNGKIYVEAEAQKTDSRQTNRTLMLSNQARMDAKPQLEIFAEDVKCSHGATVGRLDTDSLYYLRSRGISAKDARKMLTLAFGKQVSDLIKIPTLRNAIETLIADQLEEWSKRE